MIVKKTKQLGNFKRGINLYVPTRRRVSAVPSTIPLTAPTIYLSGLGFQDQDPYYSGELKSPYTLVGNGIWQDSFFRGYVEHFNFEWRVAAYAIFEGEATGVIVATNTTAPSTSLPRTGWTNRSDEIGVYGTLVISTTP